MHGGTGQVPIVKGSHMSLASIILERREELGLTQEQVAAKAGMSKPYLSTIETGKVKNPPSDGKLRSLERALGFRPNQLIALAHIERTPPDVREQLERLRAQCQKSRILLEQYRSQGRSGEGGALDIDTLAEQLDHAVDAPSSEGMIPLINSVIAGYPQSFTDLDYPVSVADDYIRCPDVHDPQAFAARVVGDSMEPKYREGDIVIFSPKRPAENGDDCFVRFARDNETTIKRVYQDEGGRIRLQPLNNAYAAQTCGAEEINGLWPAIFCIQRLRQ
jgi:phage repressor protein C with HTH and peptisase S24 domain